MRPVAAVAALLILGGCGQAGQSARQAAPDRFAGLDTEILKWRLQILAADPLCKSQVAAQKCQSFEVACKAERTVTPEDQARGITAHVVTAMTFEGYDPKLRQAQSGARTAEFTKAAAGWTRAEHAPVNTSSCADL
jgi:hypothetical protein